MDSTVPTSLYLVNQLGDEAQDWLLKALDFLPKILWASGTLLLTIVISRWLSKGIKRLLKKTKLEKTYIQIIGLVIYWFSMLSGVLITLNILGLKGIVTSVIAGAGFTSIVIAFGTQDISKNLISGALIIMGRQFKVGDNIFVQGGYEGIVRQITLRAIVLETTDGRIITVPNSTLFSQVVTNLTASGKRKVLIDIKLRYNADFDKLREDIVDVLMKNPTVFKKPTPEVLIAEFIDKGILIRIGYWTDSSPMLQQQSISSVNEEILNYLKDKKYLFE